MSGNINTPSSGDINLRFGKNNPVTLKNDGGVNKQSFNLIGSEYTQYTESVFNHYDGDKNGILDRGELANFYSDVQGAAGRNGNLKEWEANRFMKKHLGFADAKKSESRNFLQRFLTMIGAGTDEINEATRNGNTVEVSYNNTESVTNKSAKYTDVGGTSVLSEEVYIENDATIRTVYNTSTEDPNDIINKFMTQNFNDPRVSNNILRTDTLPENVATVEKKFGSDGTTLQECRFLNQDGQPLCVRTYANADGGGQVITQTGPDGRTMQAKFTTNPAGQLISEEMYNEQGQLTGTKEYANDDNNTIITKDANGGITHVAHGNFEVEIQYKEGNGQQHPISHARAGESFDETAARLGFGKNENPDGYAEFCVLNSAAKGRIGAGGWFKLKEDVILPKGSEAKINLANYSVDPQAEIAVYNETYNINDGVRKQKERNNALNATNQMVEEFVNNTALTPSNGTTTGTDGAFKGCNYKQVSNGGQIIKIFTDNNNNHGLVIRTDEDNPESENYIHFKGITDNSYNPTMIGADDTKGNDNVMSEFNISKDDATAAMIQRILTQLFGGEWPAKPEVTTQ